MWTTLRGRVVAAVHPEGAGDAWLQMHPDFRALEPALIVHAQTNPARGNPARVEIAVMSYDAVRESNLAAAGFCRTGHTGAFRRMRIPRAPVGIVNVDPEYTMRTARPANPDDCRKIADLLDAAPNRDFHTGAELETFNRHAPSFRSDLVAEAPDGTFAAYVRIAYDGANGQAIYEPVCTHPDHRRHPHARGTPPSPGVRRC